MNNSEGKTFIEKLPSNSSIEKVLKRIVLVVFIIGVFALIVFGIALSSAIMPMDVNDHTEIEFKVESGWGTSKVVEKLAEQKIIKNATLVKVYLKIRPRDGIKEGTYVLMKSMSVDEILKKLSSNESIENETIDIRFIEGKRLTDYLKQLSNILDEEYDDVLAVTRDKEFLGELINDFWFIDKSILDNNVMYPLEGYIFPDTYNIRKNSTTKEAIRVFITELGKKLEPYKEDITKNNKSVHSLLTLASMVELEAGKGTVSINGEDVSERAAVSSVFTNRLAIGMKLGSDVTTFYAEQKTFQEGLTQAELDKCNAYNTRGACVKGLPAGPICSPSFQAIEAAIKPADTKYYYFVADKNGKLYFAENETGHQNNISYLKSHELWG
ncbi:MAG: endolytic transglycosylase MltG [Bacilli bacterium]|nr:endolytic transglycosylase MltG [Bacilli bacterium]